MSFSDLPLLDVMVRRMDWLNRRTEVLADNVANVNTPGFRAQDLEAVGFEDLLRQAGRQKPTLGMTRTSAGHITGGASSAFLSARATATLYEREGEESLSGNTVNLDKELIELGKTQAEYQLTVNLLRKHMNLLRIAIGDQAR